MIASRADKGVGCMDFLRKAPHSLHTGRRRFDGIHREPNLIALIDATPERKNMTA